MNTRATGLNMGGLKQEASRMNADCRIIDLFVWIQLKKDIFSGIHGYGGSWQPIFFFCTACFTR